MPLVSARKRLLACFVMVGALFAPQAVAAHAARPVMSAEENREAAETSWWLDAMQIRQAHAITTGAGARVCLMDSAVDTAHPALSRTTFGPNSRNSGQNAIDGGKEDTDEHGTMMTGLLAAKPSPESQFLGVAPDATIITTPSDDVTDPLFASRKSVDFCLQNGAKVIVAAFDSPFEFETMRKIEAAQAIVVKSTGNDNEATYDRHFGIMFVGGVDRSLRHDPAAVGLAWGTDDDAYSTTHPYVAGTAVVGPFSIDKDTEECMLAPTKGGGFEEFCGTSASAAVVAGVVALVQSKYPNLDAANVANRVLKTAKPLGAAPPSAAYGVGLPQAYRALTEQLVPVTENPLGSATTGSGGVFLPGPHALADPRTVPPPLARTSATGDSLLGVAQNIWIALAVTLTIVALAVTIPAVLMRRRRRQQPQVAHWPPTHPVAYPGQWHPQAWPPPPTWQTQPPAQHLPPSEGR